MRCNSSAVEAVKPMEDSGLKCEPMFRYAGQLYRISDLPTPNLDERWVLRRKQMVAAAVLAGSLLSATAKQRYWMLESELKLWCRSVEQNDTSLISTTHAYKVTKGTGWDFPECDLTLLDGSALADRWFGMQTIEELRSKQYLVLKSGGRTIRFTAEESHMLKLLVCYEGKVVPNEMFMYDRHRRRPHAIPPEQKVVDVTICKVRSKINETGLQLGIRSIWGRGYMLLSPTSGVTYI